MIFSNRVLMTDMKAPASWKQKLTIEEYRVLNSEKSRYYQPFFATYRTKKIRDYDFDTGDYVGWKPIQVGIGPPIGYEYVGYWAARTIDQILNSNVLMQRILRHDS